MNGESCVWMRSVTKGKKQEEEEKFSCTPQEEDHVGKLNQERPQDWYREIVQNQQIKPHTDDDDDEPVQDSVSEEQQQQ